MMIQRALTLSLLFLATLQPLQAGELANGGMISIIPPDLPPPMTLEEQLNSSGNPLQRSSRFSWSMENHDRPDSFEYRSMRPDAPLQTPKWEIFQWEPKQGNQP